MGPWIELLIILQEPIVGETVKTRMACMGLSESVPMALLWSNFNGTVCTHMACFGSWSGAWLYHHYYMDSFDLGGETADGIMRTDCWWDGGNVNGSYGLIRIGTDRL